MDAECRTLVLIRLPVSQTQRCRNSLTKDLSILENYNGRVCGIAESVRVKEGCWPKSTCLAVLEFDSLGDAQWWFQGTQDVKQSDWLGGVDIIAVPLLAGAPGQNYITIHELGKVEPCALDSKYSPAMKQSLGCCGATQIVKPGNLSASYRGGWEPGTIELVAWTSEDDANKWMTSADNREFHTLRKQISRSHVVGFYLCPLKTEWDYHSPW